MRPQDLHEFTRKQPFAPFRILTTDGRTYDIWHPDQIIPLVSRVIIGVSGNNGVPDRSEHVSLIHIVRIEELEPGASKRPAR